MSRLSSRSMSLKRLWHRVHFNVKPLGNRSWGRSPPQSKLQRLYPKAASGTLEWGIGD
ncbi:hypothetical protein L5220_09330 [Synechococcus sp. PCC 6716]|nr:hypothetical protein [Synechococcus sp. PCC 6716]